MENVALAWEDVRPKPWSRAVLQKPPPPPPPPWWDGLPPEQAAAAAHADKQGLTLRFDSPEVWVALRGGVEVGRVVPRVHRWARTDGASGSAWWMAAIGRVAEPPPVPRRESK